DFHLISSLDDIAWLFNIRGSDVNYNPVVLSFALISERSATLYINDEKLSEENLNSLLKNGIEIKKYDQIQHDISKLPDEKSILIDPKRNCIALYKLIPKHTKIIKDTNPTAHLKAIKNEVEINNVKTVMIKDGVAITKFLKWIKDN